MSSRLPLLLAAAFFVLMNALLWRAEFGTRHQSGNTVPVETVWQKMLLAPDSSRLEIRHHGKKIGYGTWAPLVADASGSRLLEDLPAEDGMIAEPAGYSVDFGGTFSV